MSDNVRQLQLAEPTCHLPAGTTVVVFDDAHELMMIRMAELVRERDNLKQSIQLMGDSMNHSLPGGVRR